MKTFKALSALLSYPSEELQAAIPAIREVLDSEGLVPADLRRGMEPLLSAMAGDDIYALQERYVLLFDRSRTLSLNLFEHIHGESRDRGGAMVDLLETYRAGGFDLTGPELPDHLPVLLEFLSTRPLDGPCPRRAKSSPMRALSSRYWPNGWRGAKPTMRRSWRPLPRWRMPQATAPNRRQCWTCPMMTPKIWRRWTPSIRRPRSRSPRIPMQAAPSRAISLQRWMFP